MSTNSQSEEAQFTKLLTFLFRRSVEDTIKSKICFVLSNEYYLEDDEDERYPVRESDRFSDDIVTTYQIQICSVFQDEAWGSTHNINFEARGELAALLDRYELPSKFFGYFNNDDGDYQQDIFTIDEFKEGFRFSLPQDYLSEIKGNAEYFIQEASAPFMFELLKS